MNWVLLIFGSYMWLSEIRVLSLSLSLSLSLCFSSENNGRRSTKSTQLSLTKRSAQIFFEPQTVAQPPVEEIWEHRSSTEISTQNLISWVFLHYVWIYWLIHDLLLLGFMGFFFFFFLSFMFFSFTLFVDLIYSYLINQFRVNKLIWFPYSFLSFNKNFGLFSIFACQLFDLRPSLIDIQKQWYC